MTLRLEYTRSVRPEKRSPAPSSANEETSARPSAKRASPRRGIPRHGRRFSIQCRDPARLVRGRVKRPRSLRLKSDAHELPVQTGRHAPIELDQNKTLSNLRSTGIEATRVFTAEAFVAALRECETPQELTPQQAGHLVRHCLRQVKQLLGDASRPVEAYTMQELFSTVVRTVNAGNNAIRASGLSESAMEYARDMLFSQHSLSHPETVFEHLQRYANKADNKAVILATCALCPEAPLVMAVREGLALRKLRATLPQVVLRKLAQAVEVSLEMATNNHAERLAGEALISDILHRETSVLLDAYHMAMCAKPPRLRAFLLQKVCFSITQVTVAYVRLLHDSHVYSASMLARLESTSAPRDLAELAGHLTRRAEAAMCGYPFAIQGDVDGVPLQTFIDLARVSLIKQNVSPERLGHLRAWFSNDINKMLMRTNVRLQVVRIALDGLQAAVENLLRPKKGF